ncbi:MAG: SBBP repeat-containing protein, partial [Blastocatellia bacterium]
MSNPFKKVRRAAITIAATILFFSQLSITTRTASGRGSHIDANPSPLREADLATRHRVSERYGKLPLGFEINRGQAGPDVRFLSRGAGYSLLLKSNEAALTVRNDEKSATVGMKFLGANLSPKIEGIEKQPGKSNYLIGNEPAKWRTNVANYSKVRYAAVYPGIDLVFYGNQQMLEYDFVVTPGADPNSIALLFEGATRAGIARNGDLVLQTPGGELRQRKPVIYQEVNGTRRTVAGRYVIRGKNRFGFEVAAYDRSRPLVIDPVIAYSTKGFGGAGVAVDAEGNAYVIGSFTASDFPGATALGEKITGVAKLNPAGTAFVYTTYLGVESASSIAVDPLGNVYIAGTTSRADLPAAGNGFGGHTLFKTTNGGGSWTPVATGQFPTGVAKLIADPRNTGTLYALANLLLYKSGDGGRTWSRLFPELALQNPKLRTFDAAVDPVNTSTLYISRGGGSSFIRSLSKSTDGGQTEASTGGNLSFGSGDGNYLRLAVDPVSPANVYASSNLQSVFKTADAGANWVTVIPNQAQQARIETLVADPVSTGTLYAGAGGTFYKTADGGNTWSLANNGLPAEAVVDSIAVSPKNNSLLLAGTSMGLFRSTDGGNRWSAVTNGIPARDFGFFAQSSIVFDPATPSTVYAAFGSGIGAGGGAGIFKSTDSGASWTPASNGVTNNAVIALAIEPLNPGTLYAGTAGAGTDAYLIKLNSSGTAIVYSTYIGGGETDAAHDIAVDAAGNAYVAGQTSSANFSTTAGAFQKEFRQGDAFVTKLNPSGAVIYSTYFGGSNDEQYRDASLRPSFFRIALDGLGNVYLSGSSTSTDLPLKNPLPGTGTSTAFVAKFNPALAGEVSLLYATRLPAGGQDIAVDGAGDAYVLNSTGTVTKLAADGGRVVFSTNLGSGVGNPPPTFTSGGEVFTSIAVDATGNAYVTGFTANPRFPITQNAPQPLFNEKVCILINGSPVNCRDAFVVKLNAAGSGTVFSTFLGGENNDAGAGIAVDASGNVYVAGTTDSADFPLTPGAFDFSSNGFLTRIAAEDRGATVASVSAASYQAASLARESIAAAFGVNWAATTQSASDGVPTSLAGVRVKIADSAGAARFAPLFFVSPGQINYQIPPGTTDGEATATVFFGNIAVASGPLQIAAVAPGVFAANANGRGVAAAVAIRIKADGTQFIEPVARFDASQSVFVSTPIDVGPESEQVFISLFGTGWRLRSSESAVRVTVGSVDVPVAFAGSQP